MTSRSIGRALPLDERAQPDADVRAAAAVQLDLRGGEDFPHVVHRRIAAGDDDVRAVPELARQSAELATALASCVSSIELEVSIRKPASAAAGRSSAMMNSP